jgi:hypothetical protein
MPKKQKPIDIAQMLCGIADNLINQYAILSQIPHDGERGRQLEAALAQAIEPYLPRRFGLGSGHVIGPYPLGGKAQSLQCDLVIYDALDTTPLFVGSDYKIFWHESVQVVIEVKSKLNRGKLIDALKNIQAVKALAGSDRAKSMFGVIFAFACDWSVAHPLKTIANALQEDTRGFPVDALVDLIFILDAGPREKWKEYVQDKTRYRAEELDSKLAVTFELKPDGSYQPFSVQRGAFFWFLVTILRKLGVSKPLEHFPRNFSLNALYFTDWSPEAKMQDKPE